MFFVVGTHTSLQISNNISVTEQNTNRTRRSSDLGSADHVDSLRILTASDLSSLRDLLSEKKITGAETCSQHPGTMACKLISHFL